MFSTPPCNFCLTIIYYFDDNCVVELFFETVQWWVKQMRVVRLWVTSIKSNTTSIIISIKVYKSHCTLIRFLVYDRIHLQCSFIVFLMAFLIILPSSGNVPSVRCTSYDIYYNLLESESLNLKKNGGYSRWKTKACKVEIL